MSRKVERDKLIVRMMHQNKSDEEIQSALQDFDAKQSSSPLESLMEGRLLKDAGTSLMNALSGFGNAMSSGGAGMAKAVREPNKLKKPFAFAQGAGQALFDSLAEPTKEQDTVSQALGRKNETTMDSIKNFGIDVLTDPGTFATGGALKGVAASGALGAAKKVAKPLGMATAATMAASQKPDEMGNAALPFAAMAALKPNEFKKVPDGFYSVLEKEVGNLGRKPMRSLHIGKQLKGRTTIKPDEWRDVGMDELLASKDEWKPEELVAAIQKKRPKLGIDETRTKWIDHSTAKDTGTDQYLAKTLRQQGVNFDQTHWGEDTVAHMRRDMAEAPQIQQIKDAEEYIKAYEGNMPADLKQQTENWIAKWQKELETRGGKRDYLVNEVQSDLHQKASDKIYPEPKNRWLASDTDIPMAGESWNDITPEKLQEANLLSLVKENPEWTKWNALSPEQKKARYGYLTPENKAKADKYQNIINNSNFNFQNYPSAGKSRTDYVNKVMNKTSNYASRKRQNLPATKPKFAERDFEGLGWDVEKYAQTGDPRMDNIIRRKVKFGMGIPPEVNPMAGNRPINPLSTDSIIDNGYDNANIGANKQDRRGILDLTEQYIGDSPLDKVQKIANNLREAPPPEAVMRKTWPLFNMKLALQDAVESGADRIGVLDKEGIGRILQDEESRPFRDKWHDEELPSMLESFLRSQGIENAKFGEKELFAHSPTAPIRDQYQARFMEITPEIRELVKKGMPLYLATIMVDMFKEKDEQTY
jgi:hypothetical protein